jgi:hypothetical protein
MSSLVLLLLAASLVAAQDVALQIAVVYPDDNLPSPQSTVRSHSRSPSTQRCT